VDRAPGRASGQGGRILLSGAFATQADAALNANQTVRKPAL